MERKVLSKEEIFNLMTLARSFYAKNVNNPSIDRNLIKKINDDCFILHNCFIDYEEKSVSKEAEDSYYFLLQLMIDSGYIFKNDSNSKNEEEKNGQIDRLALIFLKHNPDKNSNIAKEIVKYLKIYTSAQTSKEQKNEAGTMLEYYLSPYHSDLIEEENKYKQWRK